MPIRPTFYQRIFRSDSFLSAVSYPTRVGLTRRYCTDRICLLMIFVLLFYIGWYAFLSSNRVFRLVFDPMEEIAYKQALNRSSPILQNTQICSFDKIDLLFIIISSSTHFLERQAVRETWRSLFDAFGVYSRHLFVIGYHNGSNCYRDLVKEEAHEHDLLYLTVSDQSSTSKELHAYRWVQQHCSNVKYIFKTEDDLFLNSFLLHELVRELNSKPKNTKNRTLYNAPLDTLLLAQTTAMDKFLFGWAYQPAVPERNNTLSPYFVSVKEYPNKMYPRYCSGFGYFLNFKTQNALIAEGLKDKQPFRFSDIYFTGIIPERLNFVCEVLPYTYHQGSTEDCINLIRKSNQKELSSPPFLLCSTGRHIGQKAYSDYYQMWAELKHVYADQVQLTDK